MTTPARFCQLRCQSRALGVLPPAARGAALSLVPDPFARNRNR